MFLALAVALLQTPTADVATWPMHDVPGAPLRDIRTTRSINTVLADDRRIDRTEILRRARERGRDVPQ